MKKIMSLFIAMLFLWPNLLAYPEGEDITLYLGSNQAFIGETLVQIDENLQVAPILQNATTFVPLRFLSEQFHLKVDFLEKTNQVILSGERIHGVFTISSNKMKINGQERPIDPNNENTVTLLYQNRTFLPLRAIGEALGKKVFYQDGLIIIGDDVTYEESVVQERISALSGLKMVKDRESLAKLLESKQSNSYLYKGGSGGGSMMVTDNMVSESVQAAVPSESKSNAYSKTNVQVEGVDEADLIKTDGTFLYQISNENIHIVRANPVEQLSVTAVIKNENQRITPLELYVDGTKLIAISRVMEHENPVLYDSAVMSKRMIAPIRRAHYTQCAVYDISNPQSPVVERVFEVQGDYISSRKIKDQVYLITNQYVYYTGGKDDILVPQYKDGSKQPYQEIPLSNIRYFPDFSENNYLTVSSISVSDPNSPAKTNTLLGAGQTIYASSENLYIAASSYEETKAHTKISKFALAQGEITYLGNAKVPGTIVNQFSMDEYQGNFRIATTEYENGQESNSLYILDSTLNQRGSILKIAPNEQIYSTRFIGNRGYMVTFKLVDPLFVLDLSDIDHPVILGKLKIPGYSNYIHPVDENHIIGFGKDSEEYNGGAFYQGMKMALFDITDVNDPKEKFVELIGDRGTDSPLLSNHKALLFDQERSLLAFPVTVYRNKKDSASVTQYGTFSFNGAYVYHFSIEDGFSLKGGISHLTKEDELKSGLSYDYEKTVNRILYIGDHLFTSSVKMIQAHEIESLNYVNSVKLD